MREVDPLKAQTLSLIVVTIIIIFAATYYAARPQPELLDAAHIASTAPTVAVDNGKIGSVAGLLVGLEERLLENPDDAKGWLLLAKSYNHLGQNEKASTAYARAAELGQTDEEFELKLVQEAVTKDSWQ